MSGKIIATVVLELTFGDWIKGPLIGSENSVLYLCVATCIHIQSFCISAAQTDSL